MAAGRARGQALVEFSLVILIFLVLMMGLFDFGRAIIQANSLTNAAREGARFAIVHQNHDMIVQRVQDSMFIGDVTNTADAEFLGYYEQLDDGTLGPACSDVEVGCIAVVHVRSTWNAITPIVSFLGPIDLEAEAELSVEFVCPNANISEFDSDDECQKQP